MALLSCGWPWFRGTGPSLGTGPTALAPHLSAGHASCRHLCLLFGLFSFLPLLGQLWAWADLGGRTQAGQWRLGVGTRLESLRSKLVKLTQREKGSASHPGSRWQGQSPALCPIPLVESSKPQVLLVTEGSHAFTSSSGSGSWRTSQVW